MRENRMRRKPKVSDGRSIRVGSVGPKPRPEGVGDGQQVNNPVPPVQSEGESRRKGEPLGGVRCEGCKARKGLGKSGSGAEQLSGPLGQKSPEWGTRKAS